MGFTPEVADRVVMMHAGTAVEEAIRAQFYSTLPSAQTRAFLLRFL
jgi:ABC-type polar amino acid transport system ATPase subunit